STQRQCCSAIRSTSRERASGYASERRRDTGEGATCERNRARIGHRQQHWVAGGSRGPIAEGQRTRRDRSTCYASAATSHELNRTSVDRVIGLPVDGSEVVRSRGDRIGSAGTRRNSANRRRTGRDPVVAERT